MSPKIKGTCLLFFRVHDTSLVTNYDYAIDSNQLDTWSLTDNDGALLSEADITYDNNGNTHSTDAVIDTHYNHANRLTQITVVSGSIDYRYNAFGQRTHKITDSGTTYYLYDEAGLLLSEYNAQGDILKEYVWLNGEPLAQVVDGFVYYYHNDHLGTRQAMTDQDQNVVWQGHYTPFGDVAIVTDVVENNLRFPGQYFDEETGLHYNWHRYYDPAIGRYLTSDPLGLTDGPNTYSYVRNNPTRYIDPKGLIGITPSVEDGVVAFCVLYPHLCPIPENSPAQCGAPEDLGDADAGDAPTPIPYSSEDGGATEEDDSCEELYQSTLRTCASLSGRRRFRCYEAARINREQCYQERRSR